MVSASMASKSSIGEKRITRRSSPSLRSLGRSALRACSGLDLALFAERPHHAERRLPRRYGCNGSKAVPAGIAIPPLRTSANAVPLLTTSSNPGCILPPPNLLNRPTTLPLSTTNIALAPSSVDVRRRTTNIERRASFLPALCSESSAMVFEH